jgi:V8-like Glu-specific endopeptidase
MSESVVVKAHRTTVALRMDDGTCSGTVVGKHLLLTATHCLRGQKYLAIDGKPVTIVKTLDDGKDHTLIVVDREFDSWAFVGDEPT